MLTRNSRISAAVLLFRLSNLDNSFHKVDIIRSITHPLNPLKFVCADLQ